MAKDVLIDNAYEGVRSYVLSHQHEGGVKINQTELAKQLNISRTPLAKALHVLESEGLVDNIPNRGFFIHVPTIRQLTELFTLRQALEIIAVSYVCRYGTEENFSALENCFSGFKSADIIDYEQYYRADIHFHKMIFDLCDNRLIHRINDSMQIMPRIFSIGLLRHPRETLDEHFELVRAMRAHDEVRAQELARLHTDNTRRYLEQLQHQMQALGLDTDTISAKDITFRGQSTH